MTAATPPGEGSGLPVGHRPSILTPAMTGRVLLWAVVLANVVIVELLFFTAGPSKNAVIAVGKFVGLHLALLLILQLVLVARIPWLDRRIGMDRLTSWHRWTGLTLFWLVLLHPTLIVIGYAQLGNVGVLRQVAIFAGIYQTLVGMGAAALVVVVVGLSVRAVRTRLSYEAWHAIHVVLYAAITLALIHQMFEGSTFKSSLAATVYWWGLWAFAVSALIVGRVIVPLRRNARHQLRVSAVVPESDNTVSVYVTGRELDRLGAMPGQFLIWRFLGYNSWWQANPFSLSAAPDGRTLRLTAKAVGATSAGLRQVPVGTRVFVEGPYGAFTTLHRARSATLLVAGGVGVTPIRALLEELTGPVIVLYRVHTVADAALLSELEALAEARGAGVHVLTGRTGAGSPPNAPFEADNLIALVPDIVERDVYVCGPPAMTETVLRSLRQLGVPRRQVHAERFSLAR